MSAWLTNWLADPVTLSLAGILLVVLFFELEIVLRALGEMGNVRFQGMLEDHPALFPLGDEKGMHLSSLVTVVRWVQLVCVGTFWLVLFRLPGLPPVQAMLIGGVLPILVVLITHRLAGRVGEDTVALLLRVVRPLLYPLVRLVVLSRGAASAVAADEEEEEASDREIQAFLDVGQAAGIIEPEEGEILESLVEFFDTTVREVMTPRTEMVALADTVSYDELVETFANTHKSRIPIFHETIDRVIGVVHVKNLVRDQVLGQRSSLDQLFHDCLEVPEGKELGELLRDFQHVHQQMAIVVDEYGGTSGLVTLEDILEEIVGEIQDEHDPKQPPEWQQLGDGVYRLQGMAPLEVLEELFEIEVEDEDLDTVGGLVFARHGTVPEAGAVVVDDNHGLHFTVDEMKDRRIVAVTVKRAETDAG